MYAIIACGGKQYKVTTGQRVKLEKLTQAPGNIIEFDRVLLVADEQKSQVGAPFVEGAKVSAEVITHGRHRKINIIKFRRRKHYLRRQGHRQDYTEVQITAIDAAGAL